MKGQSIKFKFIIILIYISGYLQPGQPATTTEDDRLVWYPADSTREKFIRCRGLSCDKWERRQRKKMKLKAMEILDGDEIYYDDDDLIVKKPDRLHSDVVMDMDLDGCVWESEEDLDKALEASNRERRKVDAYLTDSYLMWQLPIVYKFDGVHTERERESIRKAMHHIEAETCIEFQEIDIDRKELSTHLIITNDYNGCHTFIGMQKELYQVINFNEDCLQDLGKIVHQLAHALGLWHEQQRSDRDSYVIVNTNNMLNVQSQFMKKPTANYNTSYDFGSVMHYSWHDGSKNGQFTVMPREENFKLNHYLKSMGQRTGLAFSDAKVINMAYCSERCPYSLEQGCQKQGYQDPKDCSRCKCLPAYAGQYCEKIAPSNDQCGGTIQVKNTTYISSPNYPKSHYKNHIECTWLLKSPKGTRLWMSFVSPFAVFSKNKGVCYHWVEIIMRGDLDAPGPRFCGLYTPMEWMFSDSNEAIVMLRANYTTGAVTDRVGFQLKINVVPIKNSKVTRSIDNEEETADEMQLVPDTEYPVKHKLSKRQNPLMSGEAEHNLKNRLKQVESAVDHTQSENKKLRKKLKYLESLVQSSDLAAKSSAMTGEKRLLKKIEEVSDTLDRMKKKGNLQSKLIKIHSTAHKSRDGHSEMEEMVKEIEKELKLTAEDQVSEKLIQKINAKMGKVDKLLKTADQNVKINKDVERLAKLAATISEEKRVLAKKIKEVERKVKHYESNNKEEEEEEEIRKQLKKPTLPKELKPIIKEEKPPKEEEPIKKEKPPKEKKPPKKKKVPTATLR